MTRSRPITFLAGVAAIPLVALVVAGCGGGGGAASAAKPSKTAAPAPPAVHVANSRLGKILVDSQGRTLYLFTKDSGTTSACTGACATPWPPLTANGKPTAGSGANASLLATSARSDGSQQVTYNGHPLYTFVMDKKPGDTNGEGKAAFGGHWFAVSPAGKQVSPKPVSHAASTSSAGNSATAPAPAPAAQAPAPAPPPQSAPPPPPPPPAPSQSNGIPQNGGGDGDADNNGGPDDGDGGV